MKLEDLSDWIVTAKGTIFFVTEGPKERRIYVLAGIDEKYKLRWIMRTIYI